MPRKSGKGRILDFLVDNAAFDIMCAEIDSDDDAVDEILDDLHGNLLLVLSCRRGFLNQKPEAPTVARNDIVSSMNDECFQQMLRLNKQQFYKIVNLIQDDAQFHCSHSCQQVPIELQVAITLYRLGASGENGTIKNIAKKFSVGRGGTVAIITNRVFRALLKYKSDYISWPDESERRRMSCAIDTKLPFCIGYINATEIKLVDPPSINETSYLCKTEKYAIKAQIVCDDKLKIRHVSECHAGSKSNSSIYRSSALVQNEAEYFTSRQWIAGDATYALTERVITPYSEKVLSSAQSYFNLQHKKHRAKVDHCLHMLKQRFASLKEHRVRIFNDETHNSCTDWFTVCCMLHNMLLTDKDYADFIEIEAVNENNAEIDVDYEPIASNHAAETKRKALCALIFTEA